MISAHTLDLEPLIPPMIALLASNNAEVKTHVCDFICLASEVDSEVGLLAANVLSQDLTDPNPAIRSTAVATICSLPVVAQHDAVTG
jgi:vesicle coat complex subunit